MGGQGVLLVAAVSHGAEQPLVAHPLQAQRAAGLARYFPSKGPQLVQACVHLGVQPLSADRLLLAAKRRPEYGQHQRCPFPVQQPQRRPLESFLHPRELPGNVGHGLSSFRQRSP
jgi:hypothetical protein